MPVAAAAEARPGPADIVTVSVDLARRSLTDRARVENQFQRQLTAVDQRPGLRLVPGTEADSNPGRT